MGKPEQFSPQERKTEDMRYLFVKDRSGRSSEEKQSFEILSLNKNPASHEYKITVFLARYFLHKFSDKWIKFYQLGAKQDASVPLNANLERIQSFFREEYIKSQSTILNYSVFQVQLGQLYKSGEISISEAQSMDLAGYLIFCLRNKHGIDFTKIINIKMGMSELEIVSMINGKRVVKLVGITRDLLDHNKMWITKK